MGEGGWQADVRQAYRSLPLGNETRGEPAVASGDSRHQHLQHALRGRVWKSVPVFLPGERLRDGGSGGDAERKADPLESVKLRALQDLRHHGSIRDHYMGAAGGWWRPEL